MNVNRRNKLEIVAWLCKWIGGICAGISMITGLILSLVFQIKNNTIICGCLMISIEVLLTGVIMTGFVSGMTPSRLRMIYKNEEPFSFWFLLGFFILLFVMIAVGGVKSLFQNRFSPVN